MTNLLFQREINQRFLLCKGCCACNFDDFTDRACRWSRLQHRFWASSIDSFDYRKCQKWFVGKPQYGSIPYRTEENMALYASTQKAEQYLNWTPEIAFEIGLKQTIDSIDRFNV